MLYSRLFSYFIFNINCVAKVSLPTPLHSRHQHAVGLLFRLSFGHYAFRHYVPTANAAVKLPALSLIIKLMHLAYAQGTRSSSLEAKGESGGRQATFALARRGCRIMQSRDLLRLDHIQCYTSKCKPIHTRRKVSKGGAFGPGVQRCRQGHLCDTHDMKYKITKRTHVSFDTILLRKTTQEENKKRWFFRCPAKLRAKRERTNFNNLPHNGMCINTLIGHQFIWSG